VATGAASAHLAGVGARWGAAWSVEGVGLLTIGGARWSADAQTYVFDDRTFVLAWAGAPVILLFNHESSTLHASKHMMLSGRRTTWWCWRATPTAATANRAPKL
jgi:hypothetical protein